MAPSNFVPTSYYVLFSKTKKKIDVTTKRFGNLVSGRIRLARALKKEINKSIPAYHIKKKESQNNRIKYETLAIQNLAN